MVISYFYLDFKLDANTQSIINKILEEQLKQNTMIDTLQDKVSENHKLLENIKNVLTTFASGSLNIINDKQPKQRLKRKDTKDRKSTRLNSSHLGISYAVFCLK